MPWIFETFKKDFCYLYLPTILTGLLCIAMDNSYAGFPFFAFIMLYVVDAGHSYVTAWRVLRPGGSLDRKKSLYLLATVLLGTMLWLYFGGYYFWPFVVYFTLFHHIRQIYGVTVWYQRLNKNGVRSSGFYVQALTLLPILAFHFRSDFKTAVLYTPQDLFLFPSPILLNGVVGINVLVFIFWVFTELKATDRPMEWNRLLSMAFPISVMTICFYFGRNLYEVIFPVIMMHGGVYVALVALSVRKTKTIKTGGIGWALFLMSMTALAAGFWELWITEVNHLPQDMNFLTPFQIAAATLVVAPGLWHYLVDSWIWKKTHKEAAQIYESGIPN